jgi:hypothetical protein
MGTGPVGTVKTRNFHDRRQAKPAASMPYGVTVSFEISRVPCFVSRRLLEEKPF